MPFGISLAAEIAEALQTGQVFDLVRAVRSALKTAGRTVARTALQTRVMVSDFASACGDGFVARVLHRVAGSALVAGAVAQVVVETAVDLFAVLTGRMTFDQLARRFPVHVLTAAGGAAGAGLGLLLTRGAPWWVSLLASIGLDAVGAYAGREFGERLIGLLPEHAS